MGLIGFSQRFLSLYKGGGGGGGLGDPIALHLAPHILDEVSNCYLEILLDALVFLRLLFVTHTLEILTCCLILYILLVTWILEILSCYSILDTFTCYFRLLLVIWEFETFTCNLRSCSFYMRPFEFGYLR